MFLYTNLQIPHHQQDLSTNLPSPIYLSLTTLLYQPLYLPNKYLASLSLRHPLLFQTCIEATHWEITPDRFNIRFAELPTTKDFVNLKCQIPLIMNTSSSNTVKPYIAFCSTNSHRRNLKYSPYVSTILSLCPNTINFHMPCYSEINRLTQSV